MSHSFVSPGESIDIVDSSNGVIDGEPCGPAAVTLPLRLDTRVRWCCNGGCEIDAESMQITHPYLGLIDFPIFVESTHGFGSCKGSPTVGTFDAEVAAISALWLNLPLILAWDDRRGDHAVDLAVSGWRLTMDARPDFTTAEREAKALHTPFLATHESVLTRHDGAPFTSEAGFDVLVGVQMAISFGLGRFVAPLLPRGVDLAGTVRWEGWQDWRCDPRWGVESWLAPTRREDVNELLIRFMDWWLDEDGRATIRYGALGSICAHNPNPTAEAGVLLAQTHLEALSWHKLVLSGVYSAAEYNAVKAEDRIREMLATCSIDTAIPDDLEALLDLATGPGTTAPQSGPGVAAWVRNRLTHPKDPTALYEIEHLVWHTKLLLLEYLDLALLHEIGYEGAWRRLYPPGRWSGTTDPVPWAA
jgi:hypothetical protein